MKTLHSRILIHTGSIDSLQIVIFTICYYIFISVGLLFVLVCCLCCFLIVCAKEWTSHSEQPPVFLYFCSVISFITDIFNILSHASGYVIPFRTRKRLNLQYKPFIFVLFCFCFAVRYLEENTNCFRTLFGTWFMTKTL